ncbi:MAG: hypothetical protein AMS18_15325 [Gemmatimonas sp. SG8_17]|nr:MAG: hypothetical protein AMS18_15325 [Gemmatimonas sp. SG8_17]
MRSPRVVLMLAGLVLLLTPKPRLTAQVPTFKEAVGHDFGERITQHYQMVRYLERVAETSDRVAIQVQGESWEGREFMLAIVTSPANHARIEEIRANSVRLSDPRTTALQQAESIMVDQPAIAWFGGSIHGFELSGSEGLLKLLEHLTTNNDPATLEVLEKVVVLIDPMLNPDGRDAFAHRNNEDLGRVPSAEWDDWANDFTRWEGTKFRSGHYYFDNNRDWFAQTQPVTRVRVQTWLAWRPQTVTDMHEMGVDDEFFFYPGAPPVTPHVRGFAWSWIARFAAAYAAAFDAAGFEYKTGEAFDYFYPGYTDGFASHLGAVGMLYEQGSTRGLMLKRSDESVRTLAQALTQQYTAAWTAARLAATERGTLLREYYDGLAGTVVEGRSGYRRYLIAPGGDPAHRAELVDILVRTGVEVDILTRPTALSGVRDRTGGQLGEHDFSAGTFVIEADQPEGRLIRALLDPETPVPDDFLAEARARIERGESARFYDISAWSLPLLYNLQGYSSTDGRALPTERLEDLAEPWRMGVTGEAEYAYMIDGGQAASVAALFHLVHRGYRAAMTLKATRIQGVDFPSGTVVVRVGANSPGVHEAVRELAEQYKLRVVSVSSGLGEAGYPSLGSSDVVSITKPDIALLAEDPISGYSFGAAWYTLDQVYQIPVTPLRVASVATGSLDRFETLVVPSASSGALRRTLGSEGVDRIRRWVLEGGTLVVLGDALEFARDSNGLGLLDVRSWYETEDGKDAQQFDVPGAILRAEIDSLFWLAAGYTGSELPVLTQGASIYLEPEGPPAAFSKRTVARYARSDTLLIAGHAWEESLQRLGGSVFVYEQIVDAGRVIAFTEDPNFRGFWRGANRLFLNSVVVGPSAP